MSFFQTYAIGLDIADHTIEVIALQKRGRRISVVAKGRQELEPGIVERGRIADVKKLKEVLTTLFANTKPVPLPKAPIIFGLPESQVYLHRFSLSDVDGKKIDEHLKRAIQTAIPIPEDDLVYTYRTKKKGEGILDITVLASRKAVIQEWSALLHSLGRPVLAIDTETLATFRDLFSLPIAHPVCIVDIGAETANMSIFGSDGIEKTRTIAIAGKVITHAIAEAAGIDADTAEMKKKKDGLAQKEKKSSAAIRKYVDRLLEEIKKTIAAFEKQSTENVQSCVLVGGTAAMSGLVDAVRQSLGIDVQLGKSRLVPDIIDMQYIEAVGLAYRGLDAAWSKDLMLPLPEEKGGVGSSRFFGVVIAGAIVLVLAGMYIFVIH